MQPPATPPTTPHVQCSSPGRATRKPDSHMQAVDGNGDGSSSSYDDTADDAAMSYVDVAHDEDASAEQQLQPGGFEQDEHAAAVAIQARVRGYRARNELHSQRAAATHVQRVARGRLARRRVTDMKAEAAVQLDLVDNDGGDDDDGDSADDNALYDSGRFGGAEDALVASLQLDEHTAATAIQARVRGYRARAELHAQRQAATHVQRVARGRATRAELHAQRQAATHVQRVARGRAARKELHAQQEAATHVQRVVRGRAARQRVQQQKDAAVTVQRVARGRLARRLVNDMRGQGVTFGSVAGSDPDNSDGDGEEEGGEDAHEDDSEVMARREKLAELGLDIAGDLEDTTYVARTDATNDDDLDEAELERRTHAATQMQRMMRGYVGRGKAIQMKQVRAEQEGAARHVQRVARGRQARRKAQAMREERHQQHQAAVKLQSVARGRNARRDVQRRIADAQRLAEEEPEAAHVVEAGAVDASPPRTPTPPSNARSGATATGAVSTGRGRQLRQPYPQPKPHAPGGVSASAGRPTRRASTETNGFGPPAVHRGFGGGVVGMHVDAVAHASRPVPKISAPAPTATVSGAAQKRPRRRSSGGRSRNGRRSSKGRRRSGARSPARSRSSARSPATSVGSQAQARNYKPTRPARGKMPTRPAWGSRKTLQSPRRPTGVPASPATARQRGRKAQRRGVAGEEPTVSGLQLRLVVAQRRIVVRFPCNLGHRVVSACVCVQR